VVEGRRTVEFFDGPIDGCLFAAIDKGIASSFDQDGTDVDGVLLKQLTQRRFVGFGRKVADVQFTHRSPSDPDPDPDPDP